MAHEPDKHTHKPEEQESKKARPQKLNAVGLPEPETEQPVARHASDRPLGERQDGPGAAPHRHDRADHVPVGSTAARRTGSADPIDGGAHGPTPEEPDAAHRGRPALFQTGSARGSGAGAGGTRVGEPEEPAADSAAGSGREAGFGHERPRAAHGDDRAAYRDR